MSLNHKVSETVVAPRTQGKGISGVSGSEVSPAQWLRICCRKHGGGHGHVAKAHSLFGGANGKNTAKTGQKGCGGTGGTGGLLL